MRFSADDLLWSYYAGATPLADGSPPLFADVVVDGFASVAILDGAGGATLTIHVDAEYDGRIFMRSFASRHVAEAVALVLGPATTTECLFAAEFEPAD